MTLTVATSAQATMSATAPIQHLCPFVDEVDNGTITLTWDTRGATFELHALRDHLASYQGMKISHEDLTARIGKELSVAGVALRAVVTSWRTAGMTITCTAYLDEPGRESFCI